MSDLIGKDISGSRIKKKNKRKGFFVALTTATIIGVTSMFGIGGNDNAVKEELKSNNKEVQIDNKVIQEKNNESFMKKFINKNSQLQDTFIEFYGNNGNKSYKRYKRFNTILNQNYRNITLDSRIIKKSNTYKSNKVCLLDLFLKLEDMAKGEIIVDDNNVNDIKIIKNEIKGLIHAVLTKYSTEGRVTYELVSSNGYNYNNLIKLIEFKFGKKLSKDFFYES